MIQLCRVWQNCVFLNKGYIFDPCLTSASIVPLLHINGRWKGKELGTSFCARKNKNLSSEGFFSGHIWMVLIKRNYSYHRRLRSWQLSLTSTRANEFFYQQMLKPSFLNDSSHIIDRHSQELPPHIPWQILHLTGSAWKGQQCCTLIQVLLFYLVTVMGVERTLSQLGVGHHAEKWHTNIGFFNLFF